jgi:HD-like signal output (HDOD) protein
MESSQATGHDSPIMGELDQIETLPSLPAVVTHIQRLVSGSRTSMSEIARAMSRDQAIAARVIRLVNSAFYGLRSRVTSIQHAIVVLGLNTVKNLVTGVSIVRAFEDGGEAASLFDRERFWLHTFSCALLSKRMAGQLRKFHPEDYFLAGLLHDTGILVLDQFFHDRFVETIQYCAANKTGYLDAERSVLGTTHEQVGEYLARKWQLPEILALATRHHHRPPTSDPELAGSLDVLSVVHLADVCTINNGYYLGLSDEQRTCDSAALHRSALAPDRIQELFEEGEKEVKDLIKEWGAQA